MSQFPPLVPSVPESAAGPPREVGDGAQAEDLPSCGAGNGVSAFIPTSVGKYLRAQPLGPERW